MFPNVSALFTFLAGINLTAIICTRFLLKRSLISFPLSAAHVVIIDLTVDDVVAKYLNFEILVRCELKQPSQDVKYFSVSLTCSSLYNALTLF